jgi:hypothetical protein
VPIGTITQGGILRARTRFYARQFSARNAAIRRKQRIFSEAQTAQ